MEKLGAKVTEKEELDIDENRLRKYVLERAEALSDKEKEPVYVSMGEAYALIRDAEEQAKAA